MTEYFCSSTVHNGHNLRIVHVGKRLSDPYRAYIDGKVAVEDARSIKIARKIALDIIACGLTHQEG